jgi:GxxExxY protein
MQDMATSGATTQLTPAADIRDVRKRIEEIREMALAVYDHFRSGYNESIYKEALMVELRNAHLPYDRERYVTIEYKNHVVGTGIADIVVLPPGLLPIPIKCKKADLSQDHREQLRTYVREWETIANTAS